MTKEERVIGSRLRGISITYHMSWERDRWRQWRINSLLRAGIWRMSSTSHVEFHRLGIRSFALLNWIAWMVTSTSTHRMWICWFGYNTRSGILVEVIIITIFRVSKERDSVAELQDRSRLREARTEKVRWRCSLRENPIRALYIDTERQSPKFKSMDLTSLNHQQKQSTQKHANISNSMRELSIKSRDDYRSDWIPNHHKQVRNPNIEPPDTRNRRTWLVIMLSICRSDNTTPLNECRRHLTVLINTNYTRWTNQGRDWTTRLAKIAQYLRTHAVRTGGGSMDTTHSTATSHLRPSRASVEGVEGMDRRPTVHRWERERMRLSCTTITLYTTAHPL